MEVKKINKFIVDNSVLLAEWDWEKNNLKGLNPDKLTYGSSKRACWVCSRGHKWEAIIADRTSGCGCPYCAGKKVLKGFNDLKTLNPDLAEEWDYEKNGDLTPENVTQNSGKKVWWKCKKGHSWETRIASRSLGNGCPFCKSERRTSLPEYILEYYLKKSGFNVIHSYKEKGYELDIYIPEKRIAIEYDGAFWHVDKTNKDLEKNLKCQKDGIKLYRIRDRLLPLNDSSIDFVIEKRQLDLPKVLANILNEITNSNVDVNIERDLIDIENLREYTEKERSVLFSNPDLAKEWNYEKNGKLRPENFLLNSGKKAWWICNKGHEWKSTIANRNNGNGCPFCSGNKVLKGFNDLNTLNPELSKEWNYEKNGDLKPDNVTANCNRKVWWICSKGHEWNTTVSSRNNGNGCPFCSGQRVLKGYTDLKTLNPDLAKEWDYVKNSSLPDIISPNSHKKAWWLCHNDHSWEATIQNRNAGSGCPFCSGNKVLKGFNDLKTLNPNLAEEWDYEKNNNLSPIDVSIGSHYKAWWKCKKGHSWKADISSRNNGNGCPFCSGQKVLENYNDLKTLNPNLAKEWHPSKNGALLPSMVRTGSGQKVWWICSKGHEWEADISSRNKGNGCPFCASKKILAGYNDLQTINPLLAKEWDYEKNNDLKPDNVSPNSHKKVWWICQKGHSWEAIIKSRNNGNACPQCSREKRKKAIQ